MLVVEFLNTIAERMYCNHMDISDVSRRHRQDPTDVDYIGDILYMSYWWLNNASINKITNKNLKDDKNF